MHDAANEWTPAPELREQITRDALLHGAGYAFINRVNGKPVELLRLNPEAVAVQYDSITGEPLYKVSDGNKGQRNILRQDILDIHAPGRCSPIKDGSEAIALALAMERHAARLFGNGARPGGVLKFTKRLDPETAKRIKESWQAAHGGSNSGGTAVLEEGGDFEPISFNSVDSQFDQMRQFAIGEIARIFRVPPIILQDYGRATWSNNEAQGRQFLTYSLMPWLLRWEGEIALKLFNPDEPFFAEFQTDALTRADLQTRTAAYAAQIAARILSPNEARAAENRPPYAGGEKFENPNTTPGTAKWLTLPKTNYCGFELPRRLR